MKGWREEQWRHSLSAKGIRSSYYARKSHAVAIEKFDPQELHKIGEGSDRVVFTLNKDKVLKVAKNPRGLAQNAEEGKDVPLTPKVVERGPDYVVVDSDANANRQKVWNKMRVLQKYSSEDFENKNPELMKELEKLGIKELVKFKNVAWGDIVKTSSWSMKDGKLVLVDAGALSTDSVIKHKEFDKKNPELVSEWRKLKVRRVDAYEKRLKGEEK